MVEAEERRRREEEISESVTSAAAHKKNDGEPPLLPPQVHCTTPILSGLHYSVREGLSMHMSRPEFMQETSA